MTWTRVDLSADEYAHAAEPPITLGLFYRGKRHALSGPPEAAKTLLALIGGLTHQRAGHGAFAIVDFEQGEQPTRLMLDELGATLDEIRAVHYITADGPPTDDDADELASAGVTFVVVDALAGAYDVSGLDDNKRADAERFSRAWIDPLWRRGILTVSLDHVTKNAETRGRFAIGSERKLGAVDVHIGLEAATQLTRGGHGLIRLTTHKDRPAWLPRPHPAELHLVSDPVTHAITWQMRPCETPAGASSADLPPAARKLLEALQAVAGDGGASGPECVDWIAANYGHGLKRETVSRMFKRLETDGLAERVNPEAAAGTFALWRVTGVTSHVTSHVNDGRVTGVTSPRKGVTRSGHTVNGHHAPAEEVERLAALGEEHGL